MNRYEFSDKVVAGSRKRIGEIEGLRMIASVCIIMMHIQANTTFKIRGGYWV